MNLPRDDSYVDRLSEELGVPVGLVSRGPTAADKELRDEKVIGV